MLAGESCKKEATTLQPSHAMHSYSLAEHSKSHLNQTVTLQTEAARSPKMSDSIIRTHNILKIKIHSIVTVPMLLKSETWTDMKGTNNMHQV
jgi:hypothetical protein